MSFYVLWVCTLYLISVLFDFSNPESPILPLGHPVQTRQGRGRDVFQLQGCRLVQQRGLSSQERTATRKHNFGCFFDFTQAILFTKVPFQTLLAFLPPTLPFMMWGF